MSSLSLSEAERTFIIHGVQDDLRADGRHRDDFRHLELETGVVSNTNGSCRLRLGETDLLVGVKAQSFRRLEESDKTTQMSHELGNKRAVRSNRMSVRTLG